MRKPSRAPRLPLPMLPALAAGLVLSGAPARAEAPAARPAVDAVFDALMHVVDPHEAAVSPDGAHVAWVERIRAADGSDTHSVIHVSGLDGAPARTVTAAHDHRAHRERDVAWSPDGRQIAFLSDGAQDGQPQLYVVPAGGGLPRALTHVQGQLQHPLWSPDGARLSVLFVAGSGQEQGALVAYKPDAGLVEDKIDEQRIAIVDAAGGELRAVSPADVYVYDYDWAPDGRRLAAEAVRGSGTNNYWIAELDVID
ncbi:MAG TPA: LpqB family beta-propeller domain-containing protein, partial [Vicinamibacteria bacterium]|nr:LpqB family beta-propeller domain-containing protein [Vicinamibacteria bacterium]